MTRISTILLSTLFLCPLGAWAQKEENKFSIDAQIRTRAEYRNGVLNPRFEGERSAGFINDRARLTLGYGRENLEIRFAAQHVGVWGQDPQIDKNGRFVLNEAWARIYSDKGWFAKLGRQPLVYDDERILGSLDWNVAGRFHDALKLGFENEHNKLHLILAFNQNDEKTIGGSYYAPGAQPYKTMQTLWYNGQLNPSFNVSLLFMNTGFETGKAATSDQAEDSQTTYMQTTGTYLTYKLEDWTFNGTFYYQFGKNNLDKKVSAYLWSLRAAYKINSQWTVGVASDYLSGDPTDSKITAFDPLYGTHHKFYGTMDYFYASAYKQGLWDNQISLNYKPRKDIGLSLTYHYFGSTYDVVTADSDSRGLGSEIDLQVDIKLIKDVQLSAGYSTMIGTDSMDAVKGGNHDSWQDWGWISLNINPRILFTRW